MVEELTRTRLGRGLAALIGDADEAFGSMDRHRSQQRVPIEFLRRNPRNPRTAFDEDELNDLAASIRERGVIQPIVVRPVPNLPDAFEIIAGERRWRAAQRAGLHELPVVVVEADDRASLELAIIENIQRSDLGPLEEATGYEALIAQHGYSQTELATTLAKSRSHVANTLRLLKLPLPVRAMLAEGELTAGHARALLGASEPEILARRVVENGLTVRDVERIVQEEANGPAAPPPARQRATPDPDSRALEAAIETMLGLVVRIDHRGGSGEVRIRYRSVEQLDMLCRRLQRSAA